MKKPKPRPLVTAPMVKVLRGHDKECASLQNWPYNPWAYFGSASDYQQVADVLRLDAIGRKCKSGGQRWITAGCNSTNCSAVIAVRESDLLEMAQQTLQIGKGGK